MNLVERLPIAAAAHPDRPALVFAGADPRRDRSLSYAQLDQQSARIAGALAALAIGRHSRIVILAPLSPELYAMLVAIWRLGAVAVFLDPSAGLAALERAVALSAPEALVAGPAARALRLLSPSLRRIPLVIVPVGPGPRSLTRMAASGPPIAALADVEPAHPALITLTSGSSGRGMETGDAAAKARAIVRSHGLLEAQHRSIAAMLPPLAAGAELTTFPVLVLHHLACGVTSLILRVPRRLATRPAARMAMDVMRRHACIGAAAAPEFWRALAVEAEGLGRPLQLRRAVLGGAEVGAALVEALGRSLPEAEILAVYGGTEAEPVACIRGEEILALAAPTAAGAGQPLGRARPEIALRVVGPAATEQAEDLEREALGPGEFWVAGAHVVGSSEQAPKGAELGWHRMGDWGYRDAAGGLWLLGRRHSLLRQAGRPIYPVAVEAAVEALPFVERAALVGHPFLAQALGQDDRLLLAIRPRAGAQLAPDWEARVRARASLAWARSVGEEAGANAGANAGAEAAAGLQIHSLVRRDRLPLDRRHRSRVDRARLRRQAIDRRLGAHLGAWFAERFPPLQHGLLIASYFVANALLAQASVGRRPLALGPREAAGGLALFCMFLLLRIIDEHKDFASDRVVHPQRLLSRGLVSLGQLRALGAAVLALELALAVWLGPAALWTCMAILVVSALIARDFFWAGFLERHLLLNALLHLSIMPLYSLFAFAAASGRSPWLAPLPVFAYAWVGYAVALAYELARKTRTPGEERPGLVTYSRDLGPFLPAWLALAAIAAGAGLSFWAGQLMGLGVGYHAAVLALVAVVAFGTLDYRRRPSPARALRLKAYAGLYIFAFDLLLAFELLRVYGLERR